MTTSPERSNNIEREVKILDIDVAVVEKRLLELGAKKLFDGNIYTETFDFPTGQTLKERKIGLRIRTVGEQTSITLKQTISNTGSKIDREFETKVSDFEAIREILLHIGLYKKLMHHRRRISYKLDNASIDMDIFPNIPPYLEIEAASDEEIEAAGKKLGFEKHQFKSWTGSGVFEHYGVKR